MSLRLGIWRALFAPAWSRTCTSRLICHAAVTCLQLGSSTRELARCARYASKTWLACSHTLFPTGLQRAV